jgi:glycosyltransferase involved in cell wall biosynthesis
MKLLLIHQGFPGQFQHLIPQLLARGDQITALSAPRSAFNLITNITYRPYKVRRGNGEDTHPLALETESKVLRAEAAAYEADQLRCEGYQPDLILAHPGWGEALFLADIWPSVPQLHYVEFAYGAKGTDTDFPDRYALEQNWQEMARGRMKNANVLLNLQTMTWGITPTGFQHGILPTWAQTKTSVIHDGINTDWACPDAKAGLRLASGLSLSATDKVITFVNRTFEPYRGIHVLIEALPEVLSARPEAQVLLVGQDTPKVSYGAHRTDGRGWLTALRNELGEKIDWSRVHALGKVPHNTLRQIFRISSAHVYLTYPFVLSWSLLEAMSCGALVIGSATTPVEEVIEHGRNGLLVPFSNSAALAQQLVEVLSKPNQYNHLREAARQTVVNRYELQACLKRQIALIDAVASGAIAGGCS